MTDQNTVTNRSESNFKVLSETKTTIVAGDSTPAETKAIADEKAPVETKTQPRQDDLLLTILKIIGLIALVILLVWGASRLLGAQQTNGNTVPVNAPGAPISAAPFAANHILWSAYGTPSFIITDGKNTESASDVFTDPTKGNLTLTIKPTEATCLLQYGITKIYTNEFSANFAANDTGAGFRVISQSYWKTLPVSDGAYNLCWPR